jgi:hypothetical protein
MYPANVQNINFKYFVFRGTKKWQKCISEYTLLNLQILSDFVIFCVAHNTKNFALRFCLIVGLIIDYVQICFRSILILKIFFRDFIK